MKEGIGKKITVLLVDALEGHLVSKSPALQ
jgi:hypothetical protein